MAKRAHFTEKDIEVFLTDENWEQIFKKRIQDWKVAKFDGIYTFIQKLFHHVSYRDDLSFTDLLNKLDSAGYIFSKEEYLPIMSTHGSVPASYSKAYIELFNYLESKGFKLESKRNNQMHDMFKHTFEPNLCEFLALKGINIAWDNVKDLTRKLRMKATETFMEMGAISMAKNGKSMKINPGHSSGVNELDDFFIKSINESLTQDNIELNFIKNYLENVDLNKEQLKELKTNLTPPQFRLQQNMMKSFGSVDFFHMVQLGTEDKQKPREWFNGSQLEVIDILEKKYGLKIVA